MRILITYYSFSGNTRRVAQALERFFREKGNEVHLQRLTPVEESKKFLVQAKQAFLKKEVDLKPGLEVDVSGYDLVVIGSPVWAFSPVPAVRRYLKIMENCKDRKFFLFVTYGSGTGRFRCLKQMEELIQNREGEVIGWLDISDKKVKDITFLTKVFEEKIKL
jgi:flavodoxin